MDAFLKVELTEFPDNWIQGMEEEVKGLGNWTTGLLVTMVGEAGRRDQAKCFVWLNHTDSILSASSQPEAYPPPLSA